jgi:hypothetical protein
VDNFNSGKLFRLTSDLRRNVPVLFRAVKQEMRRLVAVPRQPA